VNNRTMPEDNAAFSANTVDVQDLCSLGMDRALGIEKASLGKATRYKKASRFAPRLGKLFNAATQAIASCVKLQLNWMTLRVPRASAHVGTAASSSGSQAKPTAEVLERSMDIAIGPQHVAAPRSTAASSSGRKAQPQLRPTPDELAYSMDIAIGERFTVSSSTAASTSDSQSLPAEVPESSRVPQWLHGRRANFNRFHPIRRIVDGAASQVTQGARPLTGPRP
jgi:hypothetical protein